MPRYVLSGSKKSVVTKWRRAENGIPFSTNSADEIEYLKRNPDFKIFKKKRKK